MHEILNHNLYFVKEHVGFWKAASNFDVLDPNNGQELLHCREDRIGPITRILRFTKYKRNTPFHVDVRTPDGEHILSVKRGVSLFLSNVRVLDEDDNDIGGFKQKFFSIGGSFDVLGSGGNVLCTLKGKWTSWEFRFLAGEQELARVTKKWSGLGRELFTSADNYVLQISDEVPLGSPVRMLIMAAVLCIDNVLKE